MNKRITRTREERVAFRSVLAVLPRDERARIRRIYASGTPFRFIARDMAATLRDPDRDARYWSRALARHGYAKATQRADERVRRLAPPELRPWLLVRKPEPWLVAFSKRSKAEQQEAIARTRGELGRVQRAA